MDICTTSTSPGGCEHRTISGVDNGVPWSQEIHEQDIIEPLSSDEEVALRLLVLRKLRQTGLTLAQLAGRVIRGEEATNVKQYDLIAAGSAITKTNIGTAYVDILPGASGQRAFVDFTGCTEFRSIFNVNLIGIGQWGARIVLDSDNTVLLEAANLGAAGERELDSDWQSIPGAFSGLTLVRVQGKSQTAADDPIYRRCILLVR